ncbi:MAG: DNA repair protein RadA [Leptospiraceae bacterium]|nr:MAG: DNA repair protein RadA [Leptospiraceae bacterium]
MKQQTKKNKIQYICNNCHEIYSHWAGKCNKCGSWNSIEELTEEDLMIAPKRNRTFIVKKLSQIDTKDNIRISSGINDLDIVLGGGFVPGSFILIGGEPGVGKSTLMLSLAENFSKDNKKVLYFSGEESPEQIRLRANRMNITGENILISKETELNQICYTILTEKPHLIIIDSVQTIQLEDANLPGTVSQLKYTAFKLMELAKKTHIPIILIGHITREGTIAGPKLLEHMVDTVLYFESDRLNHYRILRAIKNRFGNIGEVAIFEMIPEGLRIIQTIPQEIHKENSPGCVYSVILEGSRAIAVEVQALVSRTNYQAKRMAEGLDIRRVILLTAVLEKFLKLNLSEQDIFTNLAGGLIAHEPALDLAICTAILSSYLEKPVNKHYAFIGEIGLTGEIRPTPRINARIKELLNLGFQKIYIPLSQKKEIDSLGIDIIEIGHIKELIEVFKNA